MRGAPIIAPADVAAGTAPRLSSHVRPHERALQGDHVNYIDGYLTPVPRAKTDAYSSLATRAASVLKEFGATRIVECWSDETSGTSVESYHAIEARSALAENAARSTAGFRSAVRAAADEAVVFSWVEWPDKMTRDAGMAKAMRDPRMQFTDDEPVFEGSRLIASGFVPILDL